MQTPTIQVLDKDDGREVALVDVGSDEADNVGVRSQLRQLVDLAHHVRESAALLLPLGEVSADRLPPQTDTTPSARHVRASAALPLPRSLGEVFADRLLPQTDTTPQHPHGQRQSLVQPCAAANGGVGLFGLLTFTATILPDALYVPLKTAPTDPRPICLPISISSGSTIHPLCTNPIHPRSGLGAGANAAVGDKRGCEGHGAADYPGAKR